MNLSLVLDLEPRAPGHSHVTRARLDGKVPGVVYGHHDGPMLVQVPQAALQSAVARGAEHRPFRLMMANGVSQAAIIKEIQHDLLTGRPSHVDFLLVAQGDRVHVTVPLRLRGEEDLARKGLAAHLQVHHLTIVGRAQDLPDAVDYHVAALELGRVIHVGELGLPAGVAAVEPPGQVVFSVSRHHRVATEVEEKAAPAVSPGPAVPRAYAGVGSGTSSES